VRGKFQGQKLQAGIVHDVQRFLYCCHGEVASERGDVEMSIAVPDTTPTLILKVEIGQFIYAHGMVSIFEDTSFIRQPIEIPSHPPHKNCCCPAICVIVINCCLP
jgi:hypothetical protein